MVVHHNHIEAGVGSVLERVEGADPAIHRDDHLHVLRGQHAHGGGVRAVALAQAVRDVDGRRMGDGLEETAEQRSRGRAVHVVVAEDRDFLARLQRAREPRDGPLHVLEVERIGQQPAQRRIEVVRRVFRRDAAGREHAPDQLRHLDGLGEGETGH